MEEVAKLDTFSELFFLGYGKTNTTTCILFTVIYFYIAPLSSNNKFVVFREEIKSLEIFPETITGMESGVDM